MEHALTDPGPWLAVAFLLAAILYGSVGHGGASAYLAVMSVAGFTPAVMRPCALWMNVAVASLATIAFVRAGHFRWALFWPFAVSAVPLAWMGGQISVRPNLFFALVGLSLVVAAVRLFLPERDRPARATQPGVALAAGAAIGLLSGVIGVGGGIFLTPLLVLIGWARPREAAAVSAPFILVNSLAGLAGLARAADAPLPAALPVWLLAVIVGGLIGASAGSRYARPQWLRPALGLVLLVASVKFATQLLA
jgi:hypothetical protein